MPKFECSRHGTRQDREEVFQKCSIHLQVRRKLEKDRAQFPSRSERLNRRQKTRHKIFRPFKPLDVRDDLVRLHPKAEVRGAVLQPVLDRRFFNKLPEGEVHFDGVEPGRVIVKEFFLRQLLRVKRRLPAWIRPSRSAGKELRHGVSQRTRLYRSRTWPSPPAN